MNAFQNELQRIETLQVVVGKQNVDYAYHLLHDIKSQETLKAFQQGKSNPWAKDNTSTTHFLVKLPSHEARIFPQVIRWLNGRQLHALDPANCHEDTHISEWCILHVLAQKFSLPSLADEALGRYQICRAPFWQGTWLPLESEIEYMYQQPASSVQMRHFLVRHFMAETFSSWSKGDSRDLATLAASNVEFNYDILKAHKEHLAIEVYPPDFCGVDGCLIHNQWTSSDVDSLQRAPSTTPEPAEPEEAVGDPILKDEEQAMAAAEVLEAMAETANVTSDRCHELGEDLPAREASNA